MRRVLLGVLGLVLLAGCGARLTPTPLENTLSIAPPTTSTVVTVPEGDCTVELSTLGTDAAMGLRVQTIEMVNCGTEPYTVNGYPTLRLYDEDGGRIDFEQVRGAGDIASLPEYDVPPAEVTLQPGEKAWAGIVWRNLVTNPTVEATNAVRMQAAAAPGEKWQDVPMEGTIDLGNTGRLGVAPWRKAG